MNCKKVLSLFIKVFSSRNLFLVNLDTIRTFERHEIAIEGYPDLFSTHLNEFVSFQCLSMRFTFNIRYLIFIHLVINHHTNLKDELQVIFLSICGVSTNWEHYSRENSGLPKHC